MNLDYKQKRLAVFASGNGSNAENLIQYFKDSSEITIALIVSNVPEAYVLERAKNHKIPALVITNPQSQQADFLIPILREYQINGIVLAGYLRLIPKGLIEAYPEKIINIHPSLLPKYGGKGMYGSHVHEAVIADNETESGITIHLVNEQFDKGKIIFQAKTQITMGETAKSLAEKIHQLEYTFFPKVVEDYFNDAE